jgi:signal peptidase II
VSRRARLAAMLYGAAGLAYLADRLTKLLAQQHLANRPPIDIVPGVVRLNYTTNSGGAFGLFGGQPWLFFTATILVCLAIVIGSSRLGRRASAVGLGMILGGALGNLTDRVIHGAGVSGRVVDFIDFRVWPVFNVADSAIVIGAIVVVLAGARRTG